MGKTNVANQIEQIRQRRGIGVSDLVRRVYIGRQTIYAIEAGTYVPNTEVALNIAREQEVTVDDLSSLKANQLKPPESLAAEVLSAATPVKGQPVRLCQIGTRWVSVPVTATPFYMPEADGIIKSPTRKDNHAHLQVFEKDEASQKRLVLAGCEPASSLLSHMVEKISGVEVVSAAASSKLKLPWLKESRVHIAVSHLEDTETGEFSSLAKTPSWSHSHTWGEGFVVQPGNPKGIKKPEDLGRKNMRLLNREPGSGSHALLDKLLKEIDLPASEVHGSDNVALEHRVAALAVVSGDVDACLATRSATQTFALGFVPPHSLRYDLVMRRRTAEQPSVEAFLDVLQRATLRRKLEVLAGYDTSCTGALAA